MLKILMIFILFSVLPSNTIDSTVYINKKNSNNIFEESLIENEKCVDLANEFENVLNNYINSRSVVYVDNKYGGIFIDDNNVLNINQTSVSGTNYLDLVETINDEGVEVQINDVQYSLDDLLNVKSYIDQNLSTYINSLYISQEENKIFVSVLKEEYINNINKTLKEFFNYYEDSMIEFNIKESLNTLTSSIKAGQEVQYKTGWWIFGTTYYGSVGFNAVDNNGNRGIVTNYHVAPEEKKMMDSSGETLGYTSRCVLNSYVDASFVPFESQNDWQSTNYIECSDPSFKITRTADPVEGARVWKVGRTTGSEYGNITSIYGTTNCDYGDLAGVLTLTDLIVSDCLSEGGDSGGPLITWTNRLSNQGIYGINFAKDLNETLTYTCKIDNVLEALDVTIY